MYAHLGQGARPMEDASRSVAWPGAQLDPSHPSLATQASHPSSAAWARHPISATQVSCPVSVVWPYALSSAKGLAQSSCLSLVRCLSRLSLAARPYWAAQPGCDLKLSSVRLGLVWLGLAQSGVSGFSDCYGSPSSVTPDRTSYV